MMSKRFLIVALSSLMMLGAVAAEYEYATTYGEDYGMEYAQDYPKYETPYDPQYNGHPKDDYTNNEYGYSDYPEEKPYGPEYSYEDNTYPHYEKKYSAYQEPQYGNQEHYGDSYGSDYGSYNKYGNTYTRGSRGYSPYDYTSRYEYKAYYPNMNYNNMYPTKPIPVEFAMFDDTACDVTNVLFGANPDDDQISVDRAVLINPFHFEIGGEQCYRLSCGSGSNLQFSYTDTDGMFQTESVLLHICCNSNELQFALAGRIIDPDSSRSPFFAGQAASCIAEPKSSNYY